ncbi:hypothetical protein [Stakelama pacifica]|uniref:hypothetical protein n=1 Tax=Stakelama pacifica TaxID=517720 RepID=UPI00105E29D0|nr:hypothetical protein [Stakelama pacifica]
MERCAPALLRLNARLHPPLLRRRTPEADAKHVLGLLTLEQAIDRQLEPLGSFRDDQLFLTLENRKSPRSAATDVGLAWFWERICRFGNHAKNEIIGYKLAFLVVERLGTQAFYLICLFRLSHPSLAQQIGVSPICGSALQNFFFTSVAPSFARALPYFPRITKKLGVPFLLEYLVT